MTVNTETGVLSFSRQQLASTLGSSQAVKMKVIFRSADGMSMVESSCVHTGTIYVWLKGETLTFNVKPTTHFRRMMDAYASQDSVRQPVRKFVNGVYFALLERFLTTGIRVTILCGRTSLIR